MSEPIPTPKPTKISTGRLVTWIAIVGSFASIVSIPLAVYFYLESRSAPDLIYYVSPVRNTLVHSGAISKLTAQYENNTITTDVTAAQVAIWNRGSSSIRPNNILSPVSICVEDHSSILEAKRLQVIRDVSRVEISTQDSEKGCIRITWDILENGDGAVFQIIYAGPASAGIQVSGTVEGQRSLHRLDFKSELKSVQQQYAESASAKKVVPLLLGPASFVFVILNIFMIRDFMRRKGRKVVDRHNKRPEAEPAGPGAFDVAGLVYIIINVIVTAMCLVLVIISLFGFSYYSMPFDL